MTKVITHNHPFMQKVDTESGQSYRLKDKDSSEYKQEFPTGVEFKLTFET
jgi:hypothetical protein